jgi:hypothetical protein
MQRSHSLKHRINHRITCPDPIKLPLNLLCELPKSEVTASLSSRFTPHLGIQPETPVIRFRLGIFSGESRLNFGSGEVLLRLTDHVSDRGHSRFPSYGKRKEYGPTECRAAARRRGTHLYRPGKLN